MNRATRTGWSRRLWTCVLLLLGTLRTPLLGQEPALQAPTCSEGRITDIFFDNHSIFDVDRFEGRSSLAWTLRLANRLHITTRPRFLRRELLFKTGECLDLFLLDESARILRGYTFLSRADVYAVPQPDGNHHVVVDTQDDWTTRVDLGLNFESGLGLERLSVTEENFLGEGVQLGFDYRQRREQRDIGYSFRTNRLFQSRWDAAITLGGTRRGNLYDIELAYPFVGETGVHAALFSFERRDDLFSYSLERNEPFTNLVVPFTFERIAVAAAFRRGRPGRLRLLGLGISRETASLPDYLQGSELIAGAEFGSGEPADSARLQQVAGQAVDGWRTRFNLMLGWRAVHFETRRGLDALRGIQDVQLGTEATLTMGVTPGDFGSGGPSADRDLYGRLSLFAGGSRPDLVFNAALRMEGRRPWTGPYAGDWRDLLGEMDLYAYWLPGLIPNHTLVGRLSAAGGWNVGLPYQLTLGGRAEVRGFNTDDFPGGRRVIFTLEDRAYYQWPAPELFDFGTTLFADFGRIWPGDVPFGMDSGMQAAVGAGIRLGTSAGTRRVVRLDFAFPVSGPGTISDMVFRVSMREFVGIRHSIVDEQLERSRWGGLGANELVR